MPRVCKQWQEEHPDRRLKCDLFILVTYLLKSEAFSSSPFHDRRILLCASKKYSALTCKSRQRETLGAPLWVGPTETQNLVFPHHFNVGAALHVQVSKSQG